MERKNIYMTLTLLLSLVLATTMVSAAVTFVSPLTAGDTISGSYLFNITTALVEPANCSFATTADGVFNVTLNDTAEDTVFNVTIDSTALTDAEDTTLTVICINETLDTETKTLVINVDNTDPSCSYNIDRDVVEFQDGIGIVTTQASTDTTDLTYAWILYTSDGTQAATSTDASPTFLGDDFNSIDEYTLELIVTDEASATDACTNQSILVKGANGDVAAAVAAETFMEENKTGLLISGGVIVVLLLGLVGILFITKKN